MPKFGMPYQTGPLNKLFLWIKQNGYEIIGDIYDECLMDASFYTDEKEYDFSEIQIPVIGIG